MQNFPAYTDTDLQSELSTLNLGPTHPATHGVFQNVLQLDGERIVSGVSTIGYIHRAFEKIAEHRPFYQITPLTDRLNYCSAPINNMGWHMTVEKLLGIQTPKRVDYMRIIIMELSRIADHIVCNGVLGVDTGAFTGFLYMMEHREAIYEIYEEVCGSRLTTNVGRIGGFERNFNDIAFAKTRKFLETFPKALTEFQNLFNRNRIFVDRTKGVAAVTAEDALSYSWSGPILRATGVDYDVRAMNPYCSYEDFDFEVPVGTTGDVYDRFLVRNEEMWQSLRIIEQALTKIDKEDKNIFHADVPEYYLPPKEEVYNNMEALIYHFKIVMGEVKTPVGEVYHSVEGANGELGFYLVNDGGRSPYRLHFRRPSFINYQMYAPMSRGMLLSDAIINMSSLNVIAGELDA
ncbi:NADH-quinone oxidoreductase subunit D [Mucilaginibacter polytrichastri]|uniref:NADH-quinone oxidoreductase subunit D n=1 Tax=Mucilaginibacter polytrichastri TaxID=1302689 RepID=A0A1Q6A619_9SPHI|nr:NADH-quinone oxidoreductase subunit D [Mucilaginibacter polytrichastri]OKS89457.1 NADH-quinone oxidoreductase subunit D 2 [Mucilaginibacter polytrichastri]SFS72290.1 NADH dehydrogenase subunit D [Mucilaginibacter polytrichastri]